MSHACYGLSLLSELPLPLELTEPLSGAPDREIRIHEDPLLDERWSRAEAQGSSLRDAGGASYLAVAEGVMVRVEGAGVFFASPHTITVAGLPGASREELGDLVVRVALGFVLQLRGGLSFHGSAVSRDGRSLALLGPPGSGKSTTACALVRRGFGLLADDTVLVGPDRLVERGVCRSRLNADSVDRLLTQGASKSLPRDRDGKHLLVEGAPGRPAALAGLLVLEPREGGEVEYRELRGFAKLEALLAHLHSPAGLGSSTSRLARSAELISDLPLGIVSRPRDRFALDELLDEIEAVLARWPQ